MLPRTTGLVFLVLLCSSGLQSFARADTPPSNDSSDPLFGVPIIGIDLGTTYSVVAIYQNGKTVVIPNDQGNRITPSYVSFVSANPEANTPSQRLVGDAAKSIASLNPTNTIYSVKRLIGRDFNSKEVQSDAKLVPFEIVNHNNKPAIAVCAWRLVGG